MQQQTAFPVLSVSNEEQEKLARDLSILTTVLNFGVIEIEQKNSRTRELQGIMVVTYQEMQDDDDMLALDTLGGEISPADRYPHEIVGGTLKFIRNPYIRPALGTGNVAFLIDDSEPLPQGALSGASTGWNREFLASHFEDGWWVIVDDVIREEIRQRSENIQKALRERGSVVNDAGEIPYRDEEQGMVPVQGEGVSPEDFAANRGGGQIRPAPMMDPVSREGGALPQRRRDGLPAGVSVQPQGAIQSQRIDKLEQRITGIESGMQDILAAVTKPADKESEPKNDTPPVEKKDKKDKKAKADTGKVEGGIAS